MKQLFLIVLVLLISPAGICQDYRYQRNSMVDNQIRARGVKCRSTLEAMRKVERHLFVPPEYRKYAYDDTALPIGYDQTISQPFIVATMTCLLDLEPGDRVLEIGTGSGYQAAVLAEIVGEVYTIEIVRELGERSQDLIRKLKYENVEVIIGDGYKGLPGKAPFDAIVVTAAPEEIPPPLIAQLREGGKMVIPVGAPTEVQILKLVEKRKGKIVTRNVTEVRFVPFTRDN